MRYGLPLIPPILVLLGATVFNRVTPFIFGMPVFFAWTLLTALSTSAVMLLVFKLDPKNKAEDLWR